MRRLLRVNLSNGAIAEENIPQRVAEDFVGGRGFCARYLYDEVGPGIDPLSPQNKLLLTTGPLAGTSAQAFSKWIAVAMSPLSGTFSRSCGGGDFGAWLKWAGFELMIVEGRAAQPVYVHIKDGKYEIRDAARVWGETTGETQRILKKEHGPRARAVCIGPAAERLVRFAPIISGQRAAGRGGMGTVMASKNLKAIVIESDRSEDLADPEGFRRLVREQVKVMKAGLGYGVFKDYGTVQGLDYFYPTFGSIPMKNHRFAEMEGWPENIGMWPYSQITQKHVGCHGCALKCGKVRRVASGKYAGLTTEGPQFEAAWAFSGPTGCADLDATLVANHLCCELGLDVISTGNTIGFAYELFEKGILTTKETDGLVLTYGDPGPMLELVERIARREGIGDILAEGHIDFNVREAIRHGLDPVEAVRLATLNGAEAYGLDDRGALSPGRRADLVVLDGELADFSVGSVFRGGELVAEGGCLMETLAKYDDSAVRDTVRLAPLGPHDLDLKLKSGRARVITLNPGSLVTDETIREVPIDTDGHFIPDSGKDLLKLVVVERHKSTGRIGLGIVGGYGLKGGAAASSIAHDSHNLIAVGDDDAAILSALRILATSGGGISLAAAGGDVLGVLPLPLGGLMTDEAGEVTASRLNELIALAHDRLRVRKDLDPFMPLSFLALPVIPDLKLTARGLFDVTKFEFVSVDA